jgi:para-aminobenzoate synthetase component 1
VTVPELLAEEEHPGLVHLVSRVRGVLTPDATWSSILAATFPPGSVTGAPKLAAMECIAEVETASRAIYCGAVGWVDADAGTAGLGVAIRTFWVSDGEVRFGTGAGITWSSDPLGEWNETELKADRLVAIAGGSWQGRMPA